MPRSISPNARIYVAGHQDLVGSAVIRALNKCGQTNLLTATREQLDLRDQAAVNSWFKVNHPEYVFLVAGTVGGIWANANRPAEFIYDNMMIHTNVVHAAYLYKVNKLLYLGSSCIYPRECPQPIREEYLLGSYLEPTSEPYAIAKIAGIRLCQAYRKQYGCNFISAIPPNLYGPNDNFDLESSHVLPALIRKFHLAKLASQQDWAAIRQDEILFGPIPEDLRQSLGISNKIDKNDRPNKPNDQADQINPINPRTQSFTHAERPRPDVVTIWGTGRARREFLHVDDLADASVFLMNHYEDSEHINMGAGKDLTIKELAETVKSIVFPEAKLIFDTNKPDGSPQKLLDLTKLESRGWKPKINFFEGIKNTYNWYQSQSKSKVAKEMTPNPSKRDWK
jgi:GDP-L-fucose synthase